jgi:fermentation-respiration switch protein FrsA (DUF1100 family)
MQRLVRGGGRHTPALKLIPFVLLAFLVLLAACRSTPATPAAEPAGSATAAAPAGGPGAATTRAPTPAPPTATYTAEPTATRAPTATPRPTPLHPLAIEAMRAREYPASPITIEATLDPGSNYDRYLASYRSDGLKIYALLTVPRGERAATGWPVVVFNHGYIPPSQYRTTERYVAYVDGFARNGYIVFRSDYRGHGDSEGDPRGGYGSPDYTVDVLNAVAALKQFPDADPARIGMWGHSMGGHITLRAMVVSGDIRAGVIWAGVVASYPDLLARWRRAGPTATPGPSPTAVSGRRWRSDLTARYGSPEENPAFWASISPNSYVAELSGPIQLHHGTADASVPYEFSELLYDEITAAGGTVEFYGYPGDNHNLSGGFGLAMQRSIAFFDQYVKNVPASP